ncbi:Aminopeptidase YpdF (MP-, MA-, MS-, AP-, NP-specific) [hydrothermal vent metagenome]|uniref:Aminopeptidase YpdF (MP-, MA-, MS-, AP-, NP-specific) n=1 Tax=hydrothermal vent metagenome TaxID=652676 RepID=A0A1W1C4Z5_9ZZZZ
MNYILKDENAIYYECSFSSDNALYLRCGSDAYFITDGRYAIEARERVVDAEVIISKDLIATAKKVIKKSKIKKLHIDPKEWTLYDFYKLSKSSSITYKKSPDFSHKKRIIKSDRELEILAKAAKLGKKAFKLFAKEINSSGFGESEFSLTYSAKSILSKYGKYELSFDPIVAIDANSAKPHALPTDSILKYGDLLLVDAGLRYKRYCSDRTRTIFAKKDFRFGRDQKFADKQVQKVYDTVLKAHDYAIKKARSGMRAKEIDALTRDIIDRAGFGRYFVHSTGHGVGLDIHEMPYISSRSDTLIEDGMVYTIEPGIYIPDQFGVRIEDMVAMVDGKAVVL